MGPGRAFAPRPDAVFPVIEIREGAAGETYHRNPLFLGQLNQIRFQATPGGPQAVGIVEPLEVGAKKSSLHGAETAGRVDPTDYLLIGSNHHDGAFFRPLVLLVLLHQLVEHAAGAQAQQKQGAQCCPKDASDSDGCHGEVSS